MVYCGKPSRGCQMCRTRRIKVHYLPPTLLSCYRLTFSQQCDEGKPTCQQCQKSRRQCPGYKDDFDIVFRNETQATERRAKRAMGSKKGHLEMSHEGKLKQHSSLGFDGSSSSDLFSGSASYSAVRSTTATSIPASCDIPLDQQALCYFLSNFVLVEGPDNSRGYLNFLIPLIQHEPPESHLNLSFSAVALAALGNRPGT